MLIYAQKGISATSLLPTIEGELRLSLLGFANVSSCQAPRESVLPSTGPKGGQPGKSSRQKATSGAPENRTARSRQAKTGLRSVAQAHQSCLPGVSKPQPIIYS
ncbi:hypothetical protein NDU88_003069 [Pleurodeles waltl]|uniref:Uncharacterized protein n=1 Tax=Pleurodeles waltl TaxID=8319 RepID=A0AAV7L0T5_PLEWA|nr:hypothetical protein NDU88_003069 [Pleurodeles waltl]